MKSINLVSIVGIIGRANTKSASTGNVTRMSVATNIFYMNRAGEPVVETTWHNVVAWNLPGDVLENLSTGQTVRVKGRMNNHKYTTENGYKFSPEIIAKEVTVINRKPGKTVDSENYIEICGTVSRVHVYSGVSSTRVARYSVVTSRAGRDKDGNPTIYQTWHNVTTWDKPGSDFGGIREGACIFLNGRIRIQKFAGSDGQEKTTLEILSSDFRLVDNMEPEED